MRWAVLTSFAAFCDDSTAAPFALAVTRDDGGGWTMESERLRAAGSMSGMVGGR